MNLASTCEEESTTRPRSEGGREEKKIVEWTQHRLLSVGLDPTSCSDAAVREDEDVAVDRVWTGALWRHLYARCTKL